MMHEARRSERGQGTLEWLLVLAAIIAAVAVAAQTVLTTGINNTMGNAGKAVEGAAAQLQNRLK